MRVFNIDISRKGISPVVQVTEHDAMSRFFTLVLRDGTADYEEPEGATYSVWYKTADSHGWYDTITLPDESTHPAVVADGNAYTIEIAEPATTSCGELALCITAPDGYQLTVSGIIMRSDDIPGYDGQEVENYYNVYITRMQENASRAENAAATAIEYGATIEVDEAAQQLNITHTDNTGDVQTWVTEAEAWAVGQRDGVDVPSTDETYHNNAKYYAQAAAQSAASLTVDTELSSTSTNPVQNKVIDATVTELKNDLDENVSDLKSAIINNDNATFPNNLVGIEPDVYYKIDPPIKAGESFTVSNPDGVATTRFVDYEWCNVNKERIGDRRYYSGSTNPQINTVSGADMYYFRWLTNPPSKILKVERGSVATPYTPFFQTYNEFAPDMSAGQELFKQSILYPGSFTNHFPVNANTGALGSISTVYLSTNLIPITSGDVLHYNLCAYNASESVICVYDKSGGFLASVPGADKFTMVSGTYTATQDGYVIASHRAYNVPYERPYFYINDSILHKANEGVSIDSALAETFVSAYGTLDGWETHAEAFSKLMADVNETEGFMFITDSHFMSKTNGTWKPYAYKIFSYLEKLYYSSPCSFVLHGGDWLGTGEAREDYLYKLSAINGAFRRNFDKYALLVGNHECGNQSAEGTMFTHDTLAATLLANVGRTYYRFDANTFHMYCFDSWQSGALDTFANEQIDWFAKSLEAETAEHIVIAIHILYDENTLKGIGDELTKCASAYNSRTTYTYDGNTYDFSGGSGKVGFVIAGHEHGDKTGIVNNIPYVITTNLTGYGGESTFNNLSLPVDLMKVDWDNATLTAYRAVRGVSGTTRTLAIIT